jgi:molecular chaperone GrpE (heat shock protein)
MLDSSLDTLSDLCKTKNEINNTSTTINNNNNNQQQQQLQNNNNQNKNQKSQLNMSSSNSSISCEEHHTYQLNEKVTNLATNIYQELEKIVKCYGRDTVKDLMPIVVNILEALDGAYQEKEEQLVENELLKDDNQQLLSQYEREKQTRKDCEQVNKSLLNFD